MFIQSFITCTRTLGTQCASSAVTSVNTLSLGNLSLRALFLRALSLSALSLSAFSSAGLCVAALIAITPFSALAQALELGSSSSRNLHSTENIYQHADQKNPSFSASASRSSGTKIGARDSGAVTGAGATAISSARFAPFSSAEPHLTPVLADRTLLEKAGVSVLAVHSETGVGFAHLTSHELERIAIFAHEEGKCGGFEALPYDEFSPQSPLLTYVFGQLSEREAKNRRFRPSSAHFSSIAHNPQIEAALTQVSETNLRDTVTHLSSFTSRHHAAAQPNLAVESLKLRIENMVRGSNLTPQIDLISHSSTKQKSLRARIVGSTRPTEIIVLGAHLDSLNQSWFGKKDAPGADDNASGSANLVEALRILSQQARPERTIDIYWYAGEEGGLLGSGEIARQAKSEAQDIIAVLQLDMTLFPGSGEFVLGSMTDFTSTWMRSYFEALNRIYIRARIIDDKCGYGCSDHASWHRQGFPALMPFEASFDRMNKNLHTSRDVIDSNSNFRHSAMFSKIALAIALDLGNSTLRETP